MLLRRCVEPLTGSQIVTLSDYFDEDVLVLIKD